MGLNLIFFLPELALSGAGLGLLLYSVLSKRVSILRLINLTTLFCLFAIGLLIPGGAETVPLFSGHLVYDLFGQHLKIGILIVVVLVLVSTRGILYSDHVYQVEYPILILFSVIGMMLMVSSTGYLSLFVGLELQSLALYVLTALKRDDGRASEAAVKYFVLGILSTGFLLFGISLVYGVTGGLLYENTAKFMSGTGFNLPLYGAFAFIFAGVLFKISAVPFHMWTPDVYEGTPTSITTFLATVPKLAAFGLVIRLFVGPFAGGVGDWGILVSGVSIGSMVWGALAALTQKNIKRLIAYSAISNTGYALIGLVSGGHGGVQATLIYIFLYVFAILCFFSCLVTLQCRGVSCEKIDDLAGINRLYPGTAFVLTFVLFSLAGIPPLAGFLGKLYIFNEAIRGGHLTLAIVGVVTSVISAAYYLWMIKVVMMDPLDADKWQRSESYKRDSMATLVTVSLVIFLMIFFIKPPMFIPLAAEAAGSLFAK
jgi:NADH-quinone oxidoreductase subunit N